MKMYWLNAGISLNRSPDNDSRFLDKLLNLLHDDLPEISFKALVPSERVAEERARFEAILGADEMARIEASAS